MNPQSLPSKPRGQGFLEKLIGVALSILTLLVGPAILRGKNLHAQTQAPHVTKPERQQERAYKSTQPRHRGTAHANVASMQPPAPYAMAARQPASLDARWPANQAPHKAKVTWDIRGLEIEASNSSLDQILHQVAADTGAKLEGLIQDQRIFGSYGPGPGCDVLSKLLDGSGYNVVMIGSRDADTPLTIILSVRLRADPHTAASMHNRSSSEAEEASAQLPPEAPPDYSSEPRPQTNQNPFANGDSPHDPVQFMEEILQRQQRIDQRQQQQQNPQNSLQP